MEEVEKSLNSIILNAYFVASHADVTEDIEIFSDKTMDGLVNLPLKNYVFEGFEKQVKSDFFSMDGALSNCTKHFEGGESYFSCLECRSDMWCVMCKDCFMNSSHTCHEYTESISVAAGGCCDCGDLEAWKSSPRCSVHERSIKSNHSLPTNFLDKFSSILKYICRLLEKIIMDDSSLIDLEFDRMILNHKNSEKLQEKNLDDDKSLSEGYIILKSESGQNMCLLVFSNNSPYLKYMFTCFEACLSLSTENIEYLVREMYSNGFACVNFRESEDECQKIKENIEKYSEIYFVDFPISCKIITVHNLYFMVLSHILTIFIHEFCSKKAELCDILAHALFRETSAASVYITNENSIWKRLRYDMIYNVLLLTLSSEHGRTYVSDLYLSKIDRIFSCYMMDGLDKEHCFVNLNAQLLTRPSVAVYLIENGFLCKILDGLTEWLQRLGVKKGESVIKLLLKCYSTERKFDKILHFFKAFNITLMAIFGHENWSQNFQSEISKAGMRMIDFCLCFDDLEPFKMDEGLLDDNILYIQTRDLIYFIHGTMVNLSRVVFICSKTVSDLAEKLVLKIKEDLNSTLGDCVIEEAANELMVYHDIERKELSMFNLSRRFFIDFLMHALIDTTSNSHQILDRIVKDELMLIWVSLPSVSSLSSYINSFLTNFYTNSSGIDNIYRYYTTPRHFHYLYLQDFTLIQILMSHMTPDRFLNFLFFNIFPKIRENKDLSQPLSSILSSPEFKDIEVYREIMVLIYNAISERHFIGKNENYNYYLTERQLIHLLALKNINRKNLLENLYFRRDEPNFEDAEISQNLNDALSRVCIGKNPFDSRGRYSLKPDYYGQVNIYYFMYDLQNIHLLFEKILQICKSRKFEFQPPDIVDLRTEFAGMNDFIFSSELFELILYAIKRQTTDSEKQEFKPTNDLLVSLMCLCFILKLSIKDEIRETYKERVDSMFAAFQDINGKNIHEILIDAKDKYTCPILDSVIDYLIKLLGRTGDEEQKDESGCQTKS